MAVELAFIGSFPNPYGKNTRKKLEDMAKGLWEPDCEDFEKVVSQSKLAKIDDILETENIINFCGAILKGKDKKERKDGSIVRIDLITHSNVDWIALRGSIELSKSGLTKAKVKFDDQVENKGLKSYYFYPCITEGALNDLDDSENGDIVITDQKLKKTWKLADVRAKLAPGAKFVIYSCESAASRSGMGISILLKHIAKTFGFGEVGAFRGLIKYDPVNGKIFLSVVDPARIDENGKILAPGKKTTDYRELDSLSGPLFVRVKAG